MQPGLVSITFRDHQPKEIVAATVASGLRAIEWGGDVHVPVGQRQTARVVAQMTFGAGLTVAAYGSYYYAGEQARGEGFLAVLETALTLNAPLVRVWAGRQPSGTASAEYRARVMLDLEHCAELAAKAGMLVATEFHANTLADTAESTHAFLLEIAHTHLRTYWQPPHGQTTPEAVASLRKLAPWVENLHVFNWGSGPEQRFPLAKDHGRWAAFLRELSPRPARAALLEFMPSDMLAELPAEAAALRELLQATSHHR